MAGIGAFVNSSCKEENTLQVTPYRHMQSFTARLHMPRLYTLAFLRNLFIIINISFHIVLQWQMLRSLETVKQKDNPTGLVHELVNLGIAFAR